MDVRNCRRCGKMFNYVSGPTVCPACKEEQEKQFQNVKQYIEDHDRATINEIAEECDVNPQQIRQWVREERLYFGDDSPVGIDCEGCGAIIKSGRFCEKCKNDLAKGLMEATRKPQVEPQYKKPSKDNPKMRFLEQ